MVSRGASRIRVVRPERGDYGSGSGNGSNSSGLATLQSESISQTAASKYAFTTRRTFNQSAPRAFRQVLRAATEVSTAEGVWYFGYGVTLNKLVLAARGLTPLEAVPARLKDYRIVFDVRRAGAVAGPTSASIREAKGEGQEVHGVLYKFTEEDYAALLRVEDAVPPADGLLARDLRTYVSHQVTVQPYGEDGQVVKAFTLFNRRTVEADAALYWGHGGSDQHTHPEEFPPSWNHLAVMYEGAHQVGLDKQYIARLSDGLSIKESKDVLEYEGL
ncbi:hypothetical protein CYMTET_8464 [Cymbomonas tetramitiformis]|uniref:gamma-glutamylcyclotransferase n=1 Tax=Cymbomonas tetramitiformis TaxID=36881 RepID=A0AAE0GTJ2_9CHLO|nr:hypothetical protein CYMTET_8464 [Cymbomonas tetramitiformis]